MRDMTVFTQDSPHAVPTQMPDCRVSVLSGKMAAREALQKLLQALRPLSLDIEETGTVELVLAEALNNIVEHAYPAGDPVGPINIEFEHRHDGLQFKITDFGRSMPDGCTPLGAPQDVNVPLDDMPEGGFGWFLIKDLAKDVSYVRANSENRLSLRLAISAQ